MEDVTHNKVTLFLRMADFLLCTQSAFTEQVYGGMAFKNILYFGERGNKEYEKCSSNAGYYS